MAARRPGQSHCESLGLARGNSGLQAESLPLRRRGRNPAIAGVSGLAVAGHALPPALEPDHRAPVRRIPATSARHRTIAKSFPTVESAPTRLSRERTLPSRRRGGNPQVQPPLSRAQALGVLPTPRPTARIKQLCNHPAARSGLSHLVSFCPGKGHSVPGLRRGRLFRRRRNPEILGASRLSLDKALWIPAFSGMTGPLMPKYDSPAARHGHH